MKLRPLQFVIESFSFKTVKPKASALDLASFMNLTRELTSGGIFIS